ncbi:MAG: hypothetical protein QW393_04460 [Candidatus Micrarchaeaceae archaeon]
MEGNEMTALKRIHAFLSVLGKLVRFIVTEARNADMTEGGNVAINALLFLIILVLAIFIMVKLGLTLQSIIGEFRKFFGIG